MKDLFIKGMRVEKKPSLEDYTRLMLHIAGTTTGTRDVPDILKILSLLGQAMIDANQVYYYYTPAINRYIIFILRR